MRLDTFPKYNITAESLSGASTLSVSLPLEGEGYVPVYCGNDGKLSLKFADITEFANNNSGSSTGGDGSITVDQTFNSASTNAQSGTAVLEALERLSPQYTSDYLNGNLTLGYDSVAYDTGSMALGYATKAYNSGIAIGHNAYSYTYSVAIGNNSQGGVETNNFYSTAIGTSSQSTNYETIAIGYQAIASGLQSSAIGAESQAGNYSVANGYDSVVNGECSIAIGIGTRCGASYATTVGFGTSSHHNYSVVLGSSTSSVTQKALTFGCNNEKATFPYPSGSYTYTLPNKSGTVALLSDITSSSSGDCNVTIDEYQNISCVTSGNSSNEIAHSYNIVIGNNAAYNGYKNVAIGSSSNSYGYSVAIGAGSQAGINDGYSNSYSSAIRIFVLRK